MAPPRQKQFLTAGCCAGLSASNGPQCLTTLRFESATGLACRLPGWINLTRSKRGGLVVAPLARMADKSLRDDFAKILQAVFSEEPQEQPVSAPRRGHTDEWYQERCIFCAKCKSTINTQYHKKGSRCQGCRRWFHNSCMPAAATTSSSNSNGHSPQPKAVQGAPSTASSSNSSSSSNNTVDIQLSTGVEPATVAPYTHSEHYGHKHSKFFHSDECQQVYGQLAKVATTGPQHLFVPSKQGWLPWHKVPQEQQQWRLLDLSEVKHSYKDAQKRGMLLKLHSKVQHQLSGQLQAYSSSKSSSRTIMQTTVSAGQEQKQKQQKQQVDGAASSRHTGATSALEDFLVVSELMGSLGDGPKDLLEDSYAAISRLDRGTPACVVTFNVYGPNHARVQGICTPNNMQKQGYATLLMKELEGVLQGAGVHQMVAIIEHQDGSSSSFRVPGNQIERWLQQRLGFKPPGSEQQMGWRNELPEYHKSLIAGCTLLVKPLAVVASHSKSG